MIVKEIVTEELYDNLITRLRVIANENSKKNIFEQIDSYINELKKYENAYQCKVNIYFESYQNENRIITCKSNKKIDVQNNNLNENLEKLVENYNEQIKMIKEELSFLYQLKEENDIDKLISNFKKRNENCQIIKEKFINDSIYGEITIFDYLKNNSNKAEEYIEDKDDVVKKIDSNSVLLISEIQNKVILPYTSEEVQELLNDEKNEYKTEQEVIEKHFTRILSEYKDCAVSRFKEAYNLASKRDNYSKLDGIKLGMEMFGKKLLHPAIISACRTTDELDVYLDCLSKNELSDFKIFDIKYEVYPTVVSKKK